jgi:hypothetical protein
VTVNVADVEVALLGGPEVIVGVGGGVVSIVQEYEAAAVLTLPAASFACTDNVWLPCPSDENETGFAQAL